MRLYIYRYRYIYISVSISPGIYRAYTFNILVYMFA